MLQVFISYVIQQFFFFGFDSIICWWLGIQALIPRRVCPFDIVSIQGFELGWELMALLPDDISLFIRHSEVLLEFIFIKLELNVLKFTLFLFYLLDTVHNCLFFPLVRDRGFIYIIVVHVMFDFLLLSFALLLRHLWAASRFLSFKALIRGWLLAVKPFCLSSYHLVPLGVKQLVLRVAAAAFHVFLDFGVVLLL